MNLNLSLLQQIPANVTADIQVIQGKSSTVAMYWAQQNLLGTIWKK